MKKSTLVLLAALATAQAVPNSTITLASWNIEHLGDARRRSGQSRGVSQKPEHLAEVISYSGADLVALVEIGENRATPDEVDNSTVSRSLEQLSERGDQAWQYCLFPKKDPNDWQQLTGIAWNSKRLKSLGQPYRLPLKLDSSTSLDLWKRWPHAMHFGTQDGQTDFVVIPIHLKSNRSDHNQDRPREQRALEMRALVECLPDVRRHFRDQDVIVLGDTNCQEGSEEALTRLVGAGYRDLNSEDRPTTWKGQAPYDRIFVPKDQAEFRACRERICKLPGVKPEQFKLRYSDHYLVSTSFVVTSDDD